MRRTGEMRQSDRGKSLDAWGLRGGWGEGRKLRRRETSMAEAQKGSIAWRLSRLEQRKCQPCTATWDLQMPLAFTSGDSKLEAWYEQVLSCSR